MKKILITASAVALLTANVVAQTQTTLKVGTNVAITPGSAVNNTSASSNQTPTVNNYVPNKRGCGTQTPNQQWDDAFNKMVEQHKQDMQSGRATATTYTIPIVFHIIYTSGQAEGSGYNISQAQVNSQIPILNADYAGIGYNYSQYSSMTLNGHPAFYDYAVAAGLPAPDAGGVVIGASGITFCLATKNASGVTLTEPGIDRVTWNSISGATDPSLANSSTAFMTLMDTKIKPATIWDPTKYFNVWVSAGGTSAVGLLGYATFPPAATTGTSAITPNWGEVNNYACTQADGVWVAYSAVGNTGAAAAPYNLGRTLTHESGHWLGLRHIWGDGNCLTDYCNDTPPASAANFVPWPTSYPYLASSCTGTPPAGNGTDGDMFMDFMDYSDDAAMWMFTTDQVNRFHSALSLSPCRSGLTASAVNLCNVTVSTPTAAFTPPSSICATQPVVFTDGSSGPPTSWSWTVTPSTGVTITTPTIQNPTFDFTTAGTYTVSLTATNSSGSNSVSHAVTVTSCTTSVCDTVVHIKNTDTLSLYTAATSTACAGGYFIGTNCYAFSGLAESYALSDFPTGSLQVTGAIVMFYRKSTTIGTHGTATHTVTTVSMVNGTTNPAATAQASKAITFANVAATPGVTNVDYAGNPNLAYTSPIIVPYVATFSAPVPLTTGFFLSLTMPPAGDTMALFSGAQKHNAANTAWVDYQSTWYQFSAVDGSVNYALAVFPIVCPATTTGISNNGLGSNINLFPNPSTGQFNFAISLPQATNLNFSVINTLGQVVFSKTENNVTNTVLTYDLSSLGKGIYFVNITDNQNNKTVKKIIIE